MAITLKELFEKLPDAFLPEKAGDLDVVIQFNLSGEEAGDWYVTVKDGTCVVGEGQHEDPTMSLGADSQDYKDIIFGKLDPMTAFMQQKVKLKGNLNMALGLTKFFKLT
jgi:putative sterol carrier protein